MKQVVLYLFLFTFTFNYAVETDVNNYEIKKEKKITENKSTKEKIDVLDFTTDSIFKNITFSSIENIDLINIYDTKQNQIFSANAKIIVGDTLNLSFLEKGIYYIEIISGEKIGAKQIIF